MLHLISGDDKHINLALKILYHLSMDDRVKVMFTQSDCVKLVSTIFVCKYEPIANNYLPIILWWHACKCNSSNTAL